MKIAHINTVARGSTGNIMLRLAKTVREEGGEARTFSTRIPSKNKNLFPEIDGHSYFGTATENKLHILLGQFTGLNGHFSYFGTKKLIKQLKDFGPDVLHLHNLHAFCIHLPLLFHYIKKNKIPVVWTLHDCWSFTGHCPHFVMAGCDKWKTECHHCPQLSVYPRSRVDNVKMAHRLKKKWFSGVENMTLVTPSRWLAELAGQSFMGQYPTRVIHNGIDLSVFQPGEGDFRQKHGLENKKILLGVASDWGLRKGLDVFSALAARLGDDYKIVLVGTNDGIDKDLPDNILSIHRTENQQELAEIYTAADLFVNPTREETYPTVNMEALACGTPVLTFRTGGSPEIPDETCGSVVDVNDIDAMEREIRRICEERPYTREACLARAAQFDMNDRFVEYLELYREVAQR